MLDPRNYSPGMVITKTKSVDFSCVFAAAAGHIRETNCVIPLGRICVDCDEFRKRRAPTGTR